MEKLCTINGSDFNRDKYSLDVTLDVNTVKEVIRSFRMISDDVVDINFSNMEEYTDHFSQTFYNFVDYNSFGLESENVDDVNFRCNYGEDYFMVDIKIGGSIVDVLHYEPLPLDISKALQEAEENIKKNSKRL